MKVQDMKALLFELNNLQEKINIYRKSNEYVFVKTYGGWIREYNHLLNKYNKMYDIVIDKMSYNESDLSTTKKTVRDASVNYFVQALSNLISNVKADMQREIKLVDTKEVLPHQMRKCFKLCVNKCPLNPDYKPSRIFIAMPFDPEYNDSYEYGIVTVLSGLGYDHYRADNEISNKDIMCKICKEVQSCGLAIVNISSLNPNVMLELGLLYGIGKPVIIIKDRKTKTISDLGCVEYIEYSNASELQQKLFKALNNFNEVNCYDA